MGRRKEVVDCIPLVEVKWIKNKAQPPGAELEGAVR